MRTIIGVALLVFSVPTWAYFVDGNDLIVDMRDWERHQRGSEITDYVNVASYSSYVKGVYDALDLSERICPENTTVGQVNAVVAKFLRSNPERWSEPAFFLVEEALTHAFACAEQE